MPWPFVSGFIMGCAGTVVGALVRTGRLRRWEAQYRNPYVPAHIRNSPLGLLVGGPSFMLMAVAGVVIPAGRPWAYLGLALGLLAFAGLAASLVVVHHPPRWLKPAWLQEEERDGRRPAATTDCPGTPRVGWRLGHREYAVSWVVQGAFLVLWWVFAWPPSLLLGAGTALSLLLARRRR